MIAMTTVAIEGEHHILVFVVADPVAAAFSFDETPSLAAQTATFCGCAPGACSFVGCCHDGRLQEAGTVTSRPVRCSAWSGMAAVSAGA